MNITSHCPVFSSAQLWVGSILAPILLLQPNLPVFASSPTSVDPKVEARELLAQAISIDTSIGHGNVLSYANGLAQRFKANGFADADVHVLPFKDTANLVVRYRGSGKGGKAIGFMAHMDVVTANRSDWVHNPFELIEENGYFFGRGTADIKQELVLLTETFLTLKRQGFVPTRDLVLILSGDEETEQETITDLAVHHRELIDVEYALNSDGGGGELDDTTNQAKFFTIQGAEKTSAGYLISVENPGGHSSQPRTENAIYTLARALNAVAGYTFPVKWNEWTLADLKASSESNPGELGQAMARFAAHPGPGPDADLIAQYPHLVGKIRTTCVPTLINGGHAQNALPQHAEATINCRIFPGTPASEVAATLQELIGPKVQMRLVHKPIDSSASPLRADVVNAVTDAVHVNYPGTRIIPEQSVYATDGAVFRAYQIPTYGVGSTFIKPSDEFAHGLNERISVDTFYKGLGYWDRLIHNLAGQPVKHPKE